MVLYLPETKGYAAAASKQRAASQPLVASTYGVVQSKSVVLLHVESRSDRRTFNGRSTDGRFSERLLLVSRHALIEVGAWLVSSCWFSSCTLLFVAALTI